MSSESFQDDPTRVMHVTVISALSFLALIAVILRLWARRIQKQSWNLSDCFLIVGLVWTIGVVIFTIYTIIFEYLGQSDMQRDDPQAIHKLEVYEMKSLLVGPITWGVAVFFIRASVLSLYIHIFLTRPFQIAGYIAHGCNAAFFVFTILAACLICRPLPFNWNPTTSGKKCGDRESLYIGIFNLLLDISVVVLPMPVLWGLQMAISKKVQLSGIFSLGIIICVLTLVRVKISSENEGFTSQGYGAIAFYTCLELLLGIIVACLPLLKPVFRKLRSSRLSSIFSSFTSGSIPQFIRLSQVGSIRRSRPTKQHSWSSQPPPKDHTPRSPSGASTNNMSLEVEKSSPPEYMDASPTYPRSTFSPIKTRTPSDDAMPGISMERSWDVDVERHWSVESDREGLVRKTKRWALP